MYLDKENSFLKSSLVDLTEVSRCLRRHPASVRYVIKRKKLLGEPKRMFFDGKTKLMFNFADYCKLKDWFYRDK